MNKELKYCNIRASNPSVWLREQLCSSSAEEQARDFSTCPKVKLLGLKIQTIKFSPILPNQLLSFCFFWDNKNFETAVMGRGKYTFSKDFQDLHLQNKLEDIYVYSEWFI